MISYTTQVTIIHKKTPAPTGYKYIVVTAVEIKGKEKRTYKVYNLFAISVLSETSIPIFAEGMFNQLKEKYNIE